MDFGALQYVIPCCDTGSMSWIPKRVRDDTLTYFVGERIYAFPTCGVIIILCRSFFYRPFFFFLSFLPLVCFSFSMKHDFLEAVQVYRGLWYLQVILTFFQPPQSRRQMAKIKQLLLHLFWTKTARGYMGGRWYRLWTRTLRSLTHRQPQILSVKQHSPTPQRYRASITCRCR